MTVWWYRTGNQTQAARLLGPESGLLLALEQRQNGPGHGKRQQGNAHCRQRTADKRHHWKQRKRWWSLAQLKLWTDSKCCMRSCPVFELDFQKYLQFWSLWKNIFFPLRIVALIFWSGKRNRPAHTQGKKNLNPHLKWHTFLFLVTGAHKGAITRFGVDSTLFCANRHFWVSVPISHGFIFRPSNFDPSNFVKQNFRAQYQIIIFCKHWDRTQQLSLTILNRKIIFNFKNVSFIVIALLPFFQWNWRGGGLLYIFYCY